MDFKASPAQRRLLDFIHANPSPLPTLGLCKSANVSRASFYRWCRDPNFRAWLGIAWTSRLLLDGISLMNQARAQAPDKFSYWRALSDLTFDPKGLGALVKWRESLVHLPPDAFLPGPDVKPKPKPKPKPPAGPRPQPDWVAELYKDSEFPPPPPPEISPEGFPIFHPESVEEWNRRHGFVDEPGQKGPRLNAPEVHSEPAAGQSPAGRPRPIDVWDRRLGFVDEPPDDPKVFSVAQPGRRGPRLSGPEIHRERAAWRSRAGRPRSIDDPKVFSVAQPGPRGPRRRSPAERPRSINVNPVRTILLLQRALNPRYPLRRRRRASAITKPARRVPRPSSRDLHREWVAWRRGLQRRPTCAGRPQPPCASTVAKPGRRGPRLSGLEVHRERAAWRSHAGGAGASGACSRLRNETVKRSGKRHITHRAGENGTPAKSASAQQARALPRPPDPRPMEAARPQSLSRTVSPRNQANAAFKAQPSVLSERRLQPLPSAPNS